MVARFLITPLLILTSGAVDLPIRPSSSPLDGRWESYTWDGLLPDESRRCQIATIRYRYYDMVTDARGPRGTYFSVNYSFIFRASGPCIIQGKTMRHMEGTIRSWTLLGYGNTVPMRFSASAQGCTGIYCPLLDTKDFTSSIRRVGSGIEETDEDNLAWHQRYDPPEALTSDQAEVRALTERMRAAFATGDRAQVAPLLSATMPPAGRSELLSSLAAQKEQYILVEGIEPIKTFIASPSEKTVDPRVSKIAFIAGALRRIDGSKTPVSLIFSKENGRWLFAGAN